MQLLCSKVFKVQNDDKIHVVFISVVCRCVGNSSRYIVGIETNKLFNFFTSVR